MFTLEKESKSIIMEDEMSGSKGKAQTVKAKLANGTTIFVQAQPIGSEAAVGLKSASFEKVIKAIEGVAQSLTEAWEKAKPSKANVEFDVEFAWDSGELLAMFVDGSASASMKVTLEWNRPSSD